MVAVSDLGSFTAASRRLGLTPSAVSKLVSRLERRLKVRLFQRTTRKVQLTDAGQRYVERARRVLSELEELDRDVERGVEEPRGLLRVTAPPLFGEVHVLPAVARCLKRWPELKVTLDFTDRMVDLVAEGFDAAVRFARVPSPTTWSARKLMDQRRGLCAAPSYLKTHGVPHTAAQVAQHQHIVFVSAGRLFTSLRLRERPGSLKLTTIPISGRIQVDSTRCQVEAALAGLGIADLDLYYARPHLQSGRLTEVMPGALPVERSVWVMHAPGPHVPPKVRVFVEAMRQRVNNEA